MNKIQDYDHRSAEIAAKARVLLTAFNSVTNLFMAMCTIDQALTLVIKSLVDVAG